MHLDSISTQFQYFLSFNICPVSIEEYYRDKVGNSVSHLNRAKGFPGAQDDMLQLTVISTLTFYSRNYIENV